MRTMQPVLQPRVWGGTLIPEYFGGSPADEPIGEAWLLSDHPSGKTLDESGEDLSDLRHGRRWFPVMIKLLHAKADLSVQVHPNDEQAAVIGDLGKTEGWLILAADDGARICYGHDAATAQEFRRTIEEKRIETCLRYVVVKQGEYYPVPAGTVHALGAGMLVLEVQEASDTTYRLYDYNRPDQHGKLRDLHIEQGLKVASFPQPDVPNDRSIPWQTEDGMNCRVLDRNSYYTFKQVQVDGQFEAKTAPESATCVILLAGDVAPTLPTRAGNAPFVYQTWLYEPGERVTLSGHGEVAVIEIPLA